MLEENSFSLFGFCSTVTALVAYPCNCKLFLKYFSLFYFLIIEPYFVFLTQNLLYCFNVLVCKISTATQGKEHQYQTTSHKGAYIVNKDPNLWNSYTNLFLLNCKVNIGNWRIYTQIMRKCATATNLFCGFFLIKYKVYELLVD